MFNKGRVQSQQNVGCDSGASFSAQICRCSFEGARFDVNILFLDLFQNSRGKTADELFVLKLFMLGLLGMLQVG